MKDTVRTRFAPSPTGYMHIGNLRTALFAYLYAKSLNGKFILRIEDTDAGRYVEGAVDVIYRTLKAAELHYDEGPDIGGPYGPYTQSERKSIYRQYAERLVEEGKAYYCFCGKEEKGTEPSEGYNRHCRDLSPEQVKALLDEGKPHVIRQRIPLTGTTSWNDLVYGEITVDNSTLDDQVLLKSDGMPTYNFANVIDDHLMGITHIIRGSEYLSSNPKYLLLYEALGWESPEYIHLPIINGQNPDGTISKLSKRHGAVSFQDLVSAGYLPEGIVNYIALLGWSPKTEEEIFTMDELIGRFSVEGVHKSPAVFDYKKLGWINGKHISMLPPEKFSEMAYPFADIEGTALESKWDRLASLLQNRIDKFSDIPEKISFLFRLGEYDTALFTNKKSKSTPESSVTAIEKTIECLKGHDDWSEESLFTAFSSLAEKMGLKLGQLSWPVRIALSGLAATPGGAVDILYLLGKEESLRRLEDALRLILKENLADGK
ncbi:MAG TPA: glutamate--tRNA ligase [Candidatus Coprenecus stercoripullorum]|nr:glutamate--tRNA ligase [Candidatus Coprenecus stercoripullorum]